MSKPKRVVWKTMEVDNRGLNLEQTLTRLNFQPGKFHIIPNINPFMVTIVYVAEEYTQNAKQQ